MADNTNEAAKQQEDNKRPMNILFGNKSEGYQKHGLQRFIAAVKELRSSRAKSGFKNKYGDIHEGPWFALFDAGQPDDAKPYTYARTATEAVQKELDYDKPSSDIVFYDYKTNTVNFSPTYLNTTTEAYDSKGTIKQSVLDEARREISELVPPEIEKRMPKETVSDWRIQSLVDKLNDYALSGSDKIKSFGSTSPKDSPYRLVVINDGTFTYNFFPNPNGSAKRTYGDNSIRITSNEERGDAILDNHIVSDKMWSKLVDATEQVDKAIENTEKELYDGIEKVLAASKEGKAHVDIPSGAGLSKGSYDIYKYNPKSIELSDEFYSFVTDLAKESGNPDKDIYLAVRNTPNGSYKMDISDMSYPQKKALLNGVTSLLLSTDKADNISVSNGEKYPEYLSESDQNRFPETYFVLQKALNHHNIDTDTYLNPLPHLHKTETDDHIDLLQTWTKANVVLGALDAFDEEDKTYAITDDGATLKAFRKYPRWQIEEKIRNSDPAKVKFSDDVKKLADAMVKSQKKEEGKTYYAFLGGLESVDFPDKETLLDKNKLAKYTYGELDYTESLDDWDIGSLVERFKEQQKVVYNDDNIAITANAYDGAENPDLLNTTIDIWRVVPENEAVRRMSLDYEAGDADLEEWTPTALTLWNNHYSEISNGIKTDTNMDNMENEKKENKILAPRQENEESLKPSENPYIKERQSREEDLEMFRHTPVAQLYILQSKYEDEYKHWNEVAPNDSDYGTSLKSKESLKELAGFYKEMLDRVNTVIEERKNGLDGSISRPLIPSQGGEWHNPEQEQQRAYAFYGQMLSFFSEQRTDYPMAIDPSHYVQSDSPVNSLMMTVYTEMKKLQAPAFFTNEDIRRFNLKIDPFIPYLPLIEGSGSDTKVVYVYPVEHTDIEQHDRIDEPELFERYDAVRAAVEDGEKQMIANRQSLESFIANPQWRIPIVSDEDPKAKAILAYTGNSARYDDNANVIYVRKKENDSNDPSVRMMNIADALSDSILERSNGFIKHETYANYNYYNATHLINAIRYGVNLGISDKGRRVEGFGPMDDEDKLYRDPRYVKEILIKSGIAAKAISNRIHGLDDGLMNTKGITPHEYRDFLNTEDNQSQVKKDDRRDEDRGGGLKL